MRAAHKLHDAPVLNAGWPSGDAYCGVLQLVEDVTTNGAREFAGGCYPITSGIK